jgi:hypothetical protein
MIVTPGKGLPRSSWTNPLNGCRARVDEAAELCSAETRFLVADQ